MVWYCFVALDFNGNGVDVKEYIIPKMCKLAISSIALSTKT